MVSKYTEIGTANIQMQDALARPDSGNNFLKATDDGDNRNSPSKEEKISSHDEQERSEKYDPFDEIEHSEIQEEESSVDSEDDKT